MKPHIVFINQSPNTMLNDIAGVYKNNNWNTTLICGYTPPISNNFDEIIFFTKYNRNGMLNRLKTWWKFTQETISFLKSKSNSINRFFLVSNPPFILYYSSILKKQQRGADIHLLIYDLYPDILKEHSKILSIPFTVLMAKLNRINFKLVDKIFTPSLSLSKAVNFYCTNTIQTIYNWSNSIDIIPIIPIENKFLLTNNITSNFRILYSGNLGITHDTSTIIEASNKLTNNEIEFLFVGDGSGMKVIDEAIKLGSKNLKRFNWQNDELFPHSIAAGSVALVSYKQGLEGYSIPSKLPYYFATGTPVIMIGNPTSELAEIIITNNLGWVVNNNESNQLVDLIIHLSQSDLSEYNKRVINFVKSNWSIANAEKFYSK